MILSGTKRISLSDFANCSSRKCPMAIQVNKSTVAVMVLAVGCSVAVAVFLLRPTSPNIERPPERKPDVEFPIPSWYSFGVIFSPDGKQFITYGGEKEWGRVDFWDVESRARIRSINFPTSVWGAALSPDGAMLIATTGDDKIRVYGRPDWATERIIECDIRHRISNLAVLTNGERFVTAGWQSVRVWNVFDDKSRTIETKFIVHNLHLSKDRKHLAVRGVVTTEILDTQTLAVSSRFSNKDGKRFKGMAFSPDGKWVAIGWKERKDATSEKGGVTIWNRETLDEKVILDVGEDDPDLLEFTNDGKLLICCTGSISRSDGYEVHAKLLFWNVDSGKLIHAFKPYSGGQPVLAVSADDRWVATRGEGKMFRLWDLRKIRQESGERIEKE